MKIKKNHLNQLDAVIWLQTAFLGDMILSTGAFNLAHNEAPHLKQYLITNPIGESALRDHQALSRIFSIKKKRLSFFYQAFKIGKTLRAMGFNGDNCILIQLHRSTRSTLIAKLIGLPILTFEETSLSSFANWRVKRVAVFHECIRNSLPLELLGIKRDTILKALPSLSISNSYSHSQEFDNASFKIGIAPGSAWKTKKWPIEKFSDLLTLLVKHQNIQLVLLGSNNEAPLVEHMRDKVQTDFENGRIINLIGKTNLEDLRYIYPQLNLLISNDSSPIHYASAFNVPTIAIFGATVSAMGFGPLATGSTVVERKGLKCRPCSAHGPNRCPLKHFKCMEEISVDEVYQNVLKRLPSKN